MYYDTTLGKIGFYAAGGWNYIPGAGGTGGTGPAFTDSFGLGITHTDASDTPTDGLSIALTLPDTNDQVLDAIALGLGFDDQNPTLADSLLSLGIVLTDDISTVIDSDSYVISTTYDDTSTSPSDGVSLGLNPAETNSALTDSRSSIMRVWLAGATGNNAGVQNPANANGQPDDLFAQLQTQTLGATSTQLSSSPVGTKVPNDTVITDAICRPYFKHINGGTLGSTYNITATWTGGSANMFNNTSPGIGTSAGMAWPGTLTFNLFAAGCNTLAKIQSLVFTANTVDPIAGTGNNLGIDAIALELTYPI